MAPSPTGPHTKLRNELGEIQTASARISRTSKISAIRQIFSTVADLIYRNSGRTRASLHRAAVKCRNYLNQYQIDDLASRDPLVSDDITTLYEQLNTLCEPEDPL